MKFFKHDTDAHNDAKMDKVLMHYGSHGYAVYFYCLELIAGKIDKNNISCQLEHDAEQIGARLKIDSMEVNAILQYLVDVGLFEREIEQSITCLKLLGRLDKSMTNSPQLRQIIGEYRQKESGNVMTSHDMSANVTPDKIRREEKKQSSEIVKLPDDMADQAVMQQFDLFWSKYPRKEGKKKAIDLFRRLNLANRTACLADDVKRRYKDRERKYIPAGDQYIKRQLWHDEMPSEGKGDGRVTI